MNKYNESSMDNSPHSIDFRLLLQSSRYDQIEREFLKMFKHRHYINSLLKYNHYRHHHHSKECRNVMEKYLVDIEEDLHKILHLLVQQLELISKYGYLAAKSSKSDDLTKRSDNHIIFETEEESHEFKEVTKIDDNQNDSEYHHLCLERDEQFRKNIQRINQMIQTSEKIVVDKFNHPYTNKLNKLDNLIEPSHSNHLELAPLKQTNTLCTNVTKFSEYILANSIVQPRHIIKEIQYLIDELHLEHDWISKKLQYYQQKTKVVLSQNQTLSEMADKVNLKNMYTLSEHLIHIMDHLYELHQLNKHHLRTIIE